MTLDGELARMRILTRRDYCDAWETIGRLERESRMIRRSMPQLAANDLARAERLRFDLAVPVNDWWAAWNARSQRIVLALATGRRATVLRLRARQICAAIAP